MKGRQKKAPEGDSGESFIKMLEPEAVMDAKVKRALAGLGNVFVALLTVNSDIYSLVGNSLLRNFVGEKGMQGVYVSVNRPFVAVKRALAKEGIDHAKIRFIDMVSRMSGANQPEARNCDYLDAPTNLTELMLALEKAVDAIKQPRKFLIVDSVATLLVYNDVEAVEKLVHALVGKANEWDTQTVLLMVLSGETRGFVQIIGQFCDKVANIE